jgi:hypothetical protein
MAQMAKAVHSDMTFYIMIMLLVALLIALALRHLVDALIEYVDKRHGHFPAPIPIGKPPATAAPAVATPAAVAASTAAKPWTS